ncbi:unnamed protein product, partial [Allacma fusca]
TSVLPGSVATFRTGHDSRWRTDDTLSILAFHVTIPGVMKIVLCDIIFAHILQHQVRP